MRLNCAAKHLCSLSPLPVQDPPQHHCANCAEPLHGGVCGYLLSELPPHIIINPELYSDRAKELLDNGSALICNLCADTLNGATPKDPPTEAAASSLPLDPLPPLPTMDSIYGNKRKFLEGARWDYSIGTIFGHTWWTRWTTRWGLLSVSNHRWQFLCRRWLKHMFPWMRTVPVLREVE